MPRLKLSIIIPAYNEQTKIKRDLQQADRFLRQQRLKGEIIVVDDGSTDQTVKIAQQFAKSHFAVIILPQKHNQGKGLALKQGIARARGDYILFVDAGYCVPFKFALVGMSLLDNGFDVAMGSRAVSGSNIIIPQPKHRIIGSRLFGALIHSFSGVPLIYHDTQCGFKLFKAEVGKKLFRQLKVRSTMFDIEILLRAHRAGYRIAEFPVDWSNDADTRFHIWPDAPKILKDLWRIKFS